MYILVDSSNNFIKEVNIFEEYPNTSFPVHIKNEDLPENVRYCRQEQVPINSGIGVICKPKDPEYINGEWVQNWTVENIDEESKQNVLNAKWTEIRSQRDHLMKDFEWRILRNHRETRLGLHNTDKIESLDLYMQSLADITQQSDPYHIQWPEFNN